MNQTVRVRTSVESKQSSFFLFFNFCQISLLSKVSQGSTELGTFQNSFNSFPNSNRKKECLRFSLKASYQWPLQFSLWLYSQKRQSSVSSTKYTRSKSRKRNWLWRTQCTELCTPNWRKYLQSSTWKKDGVPIIEKNKAFYFTCEDQSFAAWFSVANWYFFITKWNFNPAWITLLKLATLFGY